MDSAGLLGVQRRERLLDELRRHGVVRVSDLAALLYVSPITIRRDLALLAGQNRLTKVHGGAVLPGPARRRPRSPAARLRLGLVVPTLDFFWPSVITGARTAAAVLGADLRLRASSYDVTEDRRQIARLLATGEIDGLMLAPDRHDDLAGIESLGVPCVLVERAAPAWGPTARPLEAVRNDHDAGVEVALRHLAGQGHRRVGLVTTPLSPNAGHIERGFTRAAQILGLAGELVVRAALRSDPPRARAVLARCRESGTTALLVHSDLDAFTLARCAAEDGLDIPTGLALISYDDEVAEAGDPPLSAVRPAKGQIGRMAVEMLVARLTEGERRPAHRLLLVPELVVRQSSLSRRS